MVIALPPPSVTADAALNMGTPEFLMGIVNVIVSPLTGLPDASVTFAVIILF
jgi:hypothetical protein